MRMLLAGLFGLAISFPVAAEGWKVTCGDTGRCTALLVVADAETKRTLASIGLQVGPMGSEPAMIAFLPLGVELVPGFRLVIEGKVFDAPYEVCFPDGCRVVSPIAPDALSTWLDAQSMSLRFFPYGSDRAVAVDAPTAGLRKAFEGKVTLAP